MINHLYSKNVKSTTRLTAKLFVIFKVLNNINKFEICVHQDIRNNNYTDFFFLSVNIPLKKFLNKNVMKNTFCIFLSNV